MLKPESKQAVESFFAAVDTEMNAFLKARSADEYEAAAQIILEAQANGNRLHITGIGKPGHVSAYMASLFSSTGNPCYFLHGTEAVHGSCGQLVEGDVVICISNSGETGELKATVLAIKNNGCKVIGVSGNPNSWLAKESDAFLFAGVGCEGGPLNRAPRNSILAETLTLQALSVAIQVEKDWDPIKYVRCHPGGKLGQLREGEVSKMLKGNLIHPDIMAALSMCGHGDKVLIADGNYPLDSKTGQAETVYLGLKPGLPTVTDVLEAIQSVVNIEKAEVMDPADGTTPAIFGEFKTMLDGMELDKLGRYEFYDACCQDGVRLAISTGEKRVFANLLITIGVA